MSLPRLFQPFQQIQGSYVHDLLDKWFETPIGKDVLEQEKDLLAQLLPSMFGYYLVQTGVGKPKYLTAGSTIHRKLYVCEQPQKSQHYRCVCSRLDDLAIATESVDVALLHHSLDFENAPHRVLKEISRAVIPGGKIVIVGFNPWSLWGLSRFLLAQSVRIPWSGNFISPMRVSDWLHLLDFRVEGCEAIVHGVPYSNPTARKMFNWFGFLSKRMWRQRGGVYVLVATKQVSTLTPIKPGFKSVRDSLVTLPIAGIAKPSTRKPWPNNGNSEN